MFDYTKATPQLTRKQRQRIEKSPIEKKEALTAAFQRQNNNDRMFLLAMAAGEYESLKVYRGKI